jgi:hypothetical protein
LGRFLSPDPIGFAAGDANLYRYVGNTPTNLTDPSGLAPKAPNGVPQGDGDGDPSGLPPDPHRTDGAPLTDADREALEAAAREFQERLGAIGERIRDLLGTVIDVGLLGASIAFEPIDWLVTARDLYIDPYNPWNYVAVAGAVVPFLPGGAFKPFVGNVLADESGSLDLGRLYDSIAPKGLTQAGKKGLAKELGGIPRSAQPTRQGRYGQGTKWWEYTDSHGNRKIVVEHPDGSVHVGRPKPQSQHLDGSGPPKYYPEPGTGHVGE